MRCILKHRASGLYAGDIDKDFTRVYLCKEKTEALVFEDGETALNTLKMANINNGEWIIELLEVL